MILFVPIFYSQESNYNYSNNNGLWFLQIMIFIFILTIIYLMFDLWSKWK